MKDEEENKNRGIRPATDEPQEECEGHWEEVNYDDALPDGCLAWIVIIVVLGIVLLWGVLK